MKDLSELNPDLIYVSSVLLHKFFFSIMGYDLLQTDVKPVSTYPPFMTEENGPVASQTHRYSEDVMELGKCLLFDFLKRNWGETF